MFSPSQLILSQCLFIVFIIKDHFAEHQKVLWRSPSSMCSLGWYSYELFSSLDPKLSFKNVGEKVQVKFSTRITCIFGSSSFQEMWSYFHSVCFEISLFSVSFALAWVKIKGFEKQDGGWVDGWEWDSLEQAKLKLTSSIWPAGWCFLSSGAETRQWLRVLFCHSLYLPNKTVWIWRLAMSNVSATTCGWLCADCWRLDTSRTAADPKPQSLLSQLTFEHVGVGWPPVEVLAIESHRLHRMAECGGLSQASSQHWTRSLDPRKALTCWTQWPVCPPGHGTAHSQCHNCS